MSSKTPQFDAALDELFRTLVPHSRICKQKGISKYCEGEFQITDKDIEFLTALRVPPPTLCPTCRHQRRLAFTNYSKIFRRKCEVPGHDESLISIVPPVAPWTIYDDKVYLSEEWNAKDYATALDSKESFFDQMFALKKRVPHPGAPHGPEVINSDYTFHGRYIRDSYYAFGAYSSEEVVYSGGTFDSHHIFDSYSTRSSDTLYECVNCSNCTRVYWSFFSRDCVDSALLFDCANCMDCFGCVNLRNKRYCWFNEQLTKEEYEKRRKEVDMGDVNVFLPLWSKYMEFVTSLPVRAERFEASVDVEGNDISHSKDIQNGYQIEQSEHMRHVQFIKGAKDGMDMTYGSKSELLYETSGVGVGSSRTKFSAGGKTVSDCEYTISSNNCQNCFGCVGLVNTSYAIMNTVYEPEEYWKRVDEIKTAMLARGEYGEFFPVQFSAYTYNTSVGDIIYPLTKEENAALGWLYQDDIEANTQGMEIATIEDTAVPMSKLTDSILSKVILSAWSRKPFRITERELGFYRRYNLPLPTDTPAERMTRRMNMAGITRMSKETCTSCRKEINSQYKKEDGWKPYCTACYQQEVL